MMRLAAVSSAILSAVVISMAQDNTMLPPFDTVYHSGNFVKTARYGPYMIGDTTFFYEGFMYGGKYTDTCRVYLERDTASPAFGKMMERARDMRYNDIARQTEKLRRNGLVLKKHDIGIPEGMYLPLFSLGGEIMTSDYMLFPFYVTDSLLVYKEMDAFAYGIEEVRHPGRGVTIVECRSQYPDPALFWIMETDPAKGVICVRSSYKYYVPDGFYVHSSKASEFPLLVWDSTSEPDDVKLPFGEISAGDFRK